MKKEKTSNGSNGYLSDDGFCTDSDNSVESPISRRIYQNNNNTDNNSNSNVLKYEHILPLLLLSECFNSPIIRRRCAAALYVAADEYLRAAVASSDDSNNTSTCWLYSPPPPHHHHHHHSHHHSQQHKHRKSALAYAGVFCRVASPAGLDEDALARAVLKIGRYYISHGLPSLSSSGSSSCSSSCSSSSSSGDSNNKLVDIMKKEKTSNGSNGYLSDDGFCTDSDNSVESPISRRIYQNNNNTDNNSNTSETDRAPSPFAS
jgi:hypothetical protein